MLKLTWFKKMKNNIYFLIRSFLILLLFFLLLPLISFAYLPPIPDVGPIHCVANCGSGNTKPSCPNGCSGHGLCNGNGRCFCEIGWKGSADCSTPTPRCPNNCSGNGRCRKNGNCHCFAGWIGDDCLTPESSCQNNCSDNDACNEDGSCSCNLNRNLNQGTNCIKGLGGTKGFGERCKVDNGTECMKGLHCVSRQSCVLSKQKRCQCNTNSRVAECRPGGYTCGFVGTKCDPQNGQLCCNNLTCVKDYGSSTGICKQSCR